MPLTFIFFFKGNDDEEEEEAQCETIHKESTFTKSGTDQKRPDLCPVTWTFQSNVEFSSIYLYIECCLFRKC